MAANRFTHRPGFSLVELLVVIAIISLLVAGLVTVGAHVRTRALIQTTETTIQVLGIALERYREDRGGFPPAEYDFHTWPDYIRGWHNLDRNHNDWAQVWDDWAELTVDEQADRVFAHESIEALYYWLSQSAGAREALNNLPATATANADGDSVMVTGRTVSLVEVNDAWGYPLLYEPQPGGNFPLITSSGPDGVFGTTDDIISREL